MEAGMVQDVVDVEGGNSEVEKDVIARDGVTVLPPIHRVKEPKTHHMSTRIRWLWAVGYSVKEIARWTGARYQMVRNVVNTEPKRAAREDLPELKVERLEIGDDWELMGDAALEREMALQRQQDRDRRASGRKNVEEDIAALAEGGDDDEVDEITEREE
jgi:hypothetical protein